MSKISVAVDVMGGDKAPDAILSGVRQALDEMDVHLILAGPQDTIEEQLDGFHPARGSYEIYNATQQIRMDEDPINAIRKKKDSSLAVASNAVKEGNAQSMVSAGNTGAVMAICKIKWGVKKNVDRPAIATQIPSDSGGYNILIDSGANVDCSAFQLLQFAIMGAVYAEFVLGKEKPSIGLLNLGMEAVKGNELSKEAFKLFSEQPINFQGNVEGRDIVGGKVDVIVCDGFVGNIALKLSEGVAETIFGFLKNKIKSSVRGQLGGYLLKPIFHDLVEMIDYSEYGGAPLLGLNGGCIIGHGGSSPKAIKNAIRVAMLFVKNDCNGEIGQRMPRIEL